MTSFWYKNLSKQRGPEVRVAVSSPSLYITRLPKCSWSRPSRLSPSFCRGTLRWVDVLFSGFSINIVKYLDNLKLNRSQSELSFKPKCREATWIQFGTGFDENSGENFLFENLIYETGITWESADEIKIILLIFEILQVTLTSSYWNSSH